jgi:AraC-like DNA-binding protein
MDDWHTDLATRFAGLQAEPLRSGPVTGAIAAATFDEVSVFAISGSPQRVRRTARRVRTDPLELLKVCVMHDGRARVVQAGKAVLIDRGQFALYDTSRPYELELAPSWTCSVMTVPRTALGLSDYHLRQVMARPHSAAGPGRLLTSFIDEATRVPGARDPATSSLSSAAASHLSAALMGQGMPVNDVGHDELRARIQSWVRRHLADPGLCPDSVAAAHHMSRRTLYRILGEEGDGIAELIRRMRLERIREALEDPAEVRRSVGSLAARWGVTDASWLSRAFKRRYGVSPSEYRRRFC